VPSGPRHERAESLAESFLVAQRGEVDQGGVGLGVVTPGGRSRHEGILQAIGIEPRGTNSLARLCERARIDRCHRAAACGAAA